MSDAGLEHAIRVRGRMLVDLRILGPLEIVAGGEPVKIGGPRERIVLAMLALRAHRVTSVEQLVDAVWGEVPPSTARGQIQGCISGLRRVLDDAGLANAIQTRAGGLAVAGRRGRAGQRAVRQAGRPGTPAGRRPAV